MQDQQYDGVVLEDKWGKSYLCSSCLLAYADLGEDSLGDVKDTEFGRYFLHDLEPSWDQRNIWAQLYQHARPWATDLSKLNKFQLRDALLQMFARDEMRIWQLTDGWGKAPEGNGIGDGGLAPAASGSANPAPAAKASKPKGGGATAEQPVAAKTAVHDAKSVPSQKRVDPVNKAPTTLNECVQLLKSSREKIAATKIYDPKYSSEQLSEMAIAGIVAKERFIVSLQKVKNNPSLPVGYARPSSRTTAWTTTFDLVENGDTDPELLCDLNGMIYDPKADYELVIIDQGAYYQQDGAVNFIPTYSRLADLGKIEFAGEFSPQEIDDVLTPEYTAHYKAVMDEYSALGGKPWEEAKLDRFLEERFGNDMAAERKFRVRNAFNTEIGANEHFSGDGVTKTTGASGYKLEPGKNGNLEMLLFEHSPQSIADLESKGAIIRVPAKPIFGKG